MRKVFNVEMSLLLLTLFASCCCGYFFDKQAHASEKDTICIPMKTIEINPPDGVEAKRASVTFPHNTHFGFACKTCHHTWKAQEPVKSCVTSGCHDLQETPQKKDAAQDGKSDISYYKNAFHGQCIGCHKKIKAQNDSLVKSGKILKDQLPPTGPTGCIQCHPKQE